MSIALYTVALFFALLAGVVLNFVFNNIALISVPWLLMMSINFLLMAHKGKN